MSTKEKNIRVIICEVGQAPKIKIIENSLANLQKLVGGRIEVVYIDDCLMICNEEGKLDNLKPNFVTRHDVIVGDALFVGDNGEEFGSLTDEEIIKIISYIASIGRYKLDNMMNDGFLKNMIETRVIFDDESNRPN